MYMHISMYVYPYALADFFFAFFRFARVRSDYREQPMEEYVPSCTVSARTSLFGKTTENRLN